MLVSFLLMLASLYAWWQLVYTHPTSVFDRMLATSLTTPSVAKTVNQTDESQILEQTSMLVTTPGQIARSISTLQQVDDTDTQIVTESIGSPTVDYVRYNEIKTSQKNSEGKDFDFSSVVGIWGKATDEQGGGNVQQFNQTVLGVVPIANLPQAQRSQLLDQIRDDKVFQFDSDAVKRQRINGRMVYSYEVSVDPVAYVKMLKTFASSLGMTQLEQVDPSQYAGSPALGFVFEIDVLSGQIRKITYESTDRTETNNSFGAIVRIEEPTSSIGVEELQAKLQQAQ